MQCASEAGPAYLTVYSKAWSDRNRLTGGSQLISKCAREIGTTVSQFLNVHGASQSISKCTEIGPDAYKVAWVCSAPTHERLLC